MKDFSLGLKLLVPLIPLCSNIMCIDPYFESHRVQPLAGLIRFPPCVASSHMNTDTGELQIAFRELKPRPVRSLRAVAPIGPEGYRLHLPP